uniref:N-acetyllactosaminide alpha-1,3-galactosyltransferase-like n=1 Tax=Oryzias melastigma TaxID=30732 RepID=A0A3B3D1T3_ORYME
VPTWNRTSVPNPSHHQLHSRPLAGHLGMWTLVIFMHLLPSGREKTPQLDLEMEYRGRYPTSILPCSADHFLTATRSPWSAPIIWELMFDPRLYDEAHKLAGTSVALTVFAVGRYLDAYLNTFLTSAEKHFMVGLPVTFYVFTDQPEKVPNITLAPQRHVKVIKVEKYSRWQDISMMRMKTISEMIEKELRHKFNYVFCFDVDQEFKERFGSEALGESVATIHAHFRKLPKELYTYDRNPKSKAYMEKGDYYYHAAVFGGSCDKVKALADYCYLNIMEDKLNSVEALWHDESHLNKYFWLNKPTKLLSPEYCWDPYIADMKNILVTPHDALNPVH